MLEEMGFENLLPGENDNRNKKTFKPTIDDLKCLEGTAEWEQIKKENPSIVNNDLEEQGLEFEDNS